MSGLWTDITGAINSGVGAAKQGLTDVGNVGTKIATMLGYADALHSAGSIVGKTMGSGGELTQGLSNSTHQLFGGSGKTDPSKPKGDKPKPQAPVTEYAQNVQSLLHPYLAAIGNLPKQYASTLGSIQSSTDYTPQEADQALQSLASQYSPDITASATGGSSQLAGAESKVETNLKSMESPTGAYGKALKSLGTDMNRWSTVAPYKDIMTALFQHLRYSAIYTGTLPGVQGGQYPGWLNQLYSTALAQPNPFISKGTATGAKAASTNPTLPKPASMTMKKSSSPTYTPTPAPTSSGTGNG